MMMIMTMIVMRVWCCVRARADGIGRRGGSRQHDRMKICVCYIQINPCVVQPNRPRFLPAAARELAPVCPIIFFLLCVLSFFFY